MFNSFAFNARPYNSVRVATVIVAPEDTPPSIRGILSSYDMRTVLTASDRSVRLGNNSGITTLGSAENMSYLSPLDSPVILTERNN